MTNSWLTNWHSASSGSGYATPALENSQFAKRDSPDIDVYVEPGIFSPDNDGNDDVVTIGYRFQTAGHMATIVIFDAEGRPVRYLVNNDLLGAEGSYSWDGITEDNQKANIGIYLVYFEVFDARGRVLKKLIPVVVAGRLR